MFQQICGKYALGLHSISLRLDVGFKVFKTGEFQFGIYESISLVYPIGDEYHGLFPRFPALLPDESRFRGQLCHMGNGLFHFCIIGLYGFFLPANAFTTVDLMVGAGRWGIL